MQGTIIGGAETIYPLWLQYINGRTDAHLDVRYETVMSLLDTSLKSTIQCTIHKDCQDLQQYNKAKGGGLDW